MKPFACCLVIVWRLGAQDAAALEAKSGAQAAQSAQAWVHDADPRHRAWAAHWIARDRLSALTPELVKELDSYASTGNAEKLRPEDAAIQAVADALIRLDAHVPETSALNLYPKFAAQTMILLAKSDADRTDALYRVFNEDNETDIRLAAANLLAVTHPERIAKQLVDKFTMTLTVHVVDPHAKQESRWTCGGGCAADFGLGPAYGKDWPVIWEYSVQAGAQDGLPLLAPGRTDVYYSHWESPDYIPHAQLNSCGAREQLYIHGLLEQLTGTAPDSLPLHTEGSEVVAFYSDAGYLQALTALLRSKKDLFNDLVRDLARQGLLTTGDAATSKLHLTLSVDDRTKRLLPLPKIDLEAVGIVERKP